MSEQATGERAGEKKTAASTYRIQTDPHCIAIAEKRVVKGEDGKRAMGEIYWVAFRWYASLEQAVNGLRELLEREHLAEAEGLDTAAILTAIEQAKAETLAAVAEGVVTP